jgi:hypothetical protein
MSQKDRVLQKLEQAGEFGVSTSEFLRDYLYEFRSRITELRQKGHNIPKPERISQSNYKYRLVKP